MSRERFQCHTGRSMLRKMLPLAAVLCCFAAVVWWYRQAAGLNPDRILDNSVLKEKTFSADVKEITAPKSGIKAYLLEDKTNPIISMSFLFKNSGAAYDNADMAGLTNFVSEMLLNGAGALNAQQFKEEMAQNAIMINFSADMDDFSGSLITAKDNAPTAERLLEQIFRAPRFDRTDIERVRALQLKAIDLQQEHPDNVLKRSFAKMLYGTHPYAQDMLGTKSSVKKIKKEHLQNFVKERLTRTNLVIGIAGDISENEAKKMIDRIFGSLPQEKKENVLPPVTIDFTNREETINYPAGQKIAAFAAEGLPRADKNFYPLYIANHIFGGSGLNSRLSVAAREEQGLTYSIYTYLSMLDKSPLIKGGFSSTPDNYEKVREILKRELEHFAKKGITQKETDDAKNYLMSSYNLRFASIGNLSDILMYMQKENLGLDFLQKRNEYVKNVTKKEINAAAAKFFRPENFVFATVGNFEEQGVE